MADIKTPKGRLSFPGLGQPGPRGDGIFRTTADLANAQVLTSLEAAMEDWRKVALTCQPTANADYVRTVCEEIVRRARLLAESSALRFPDVAGFLLTRSRSWVLGGLPVQKIGEKLPKNLHDLGMLKLAEGSEDGGPLSGKELQSAMSHKPRIIH